LDTYGARELEIGCAEAIERGVPHAHAVRQTLQRRREEQQLPPALAVPLPDDERARNLSVRPASLSAYEHLNSPHQTDNDNYETVHPNTQRSNTNHD
jgi:hypothetical protein